MPSLVHAFLHDLRIFSSLARAQDWVFVTLCFTFILFGFYRVVEILDSSIRSGLKRIFAFLHIVGVLFFGLSVLWTVVDLKAVRQMMILPFFGISFLILAGLHIYLALLRRVRNSSTSGDSDPNMSP